MSSADQIRDFSVPPPISIPHQFACAKKTIAQEGEAGEHCYLVMQGVLRCSMSGPHGKRQIVGFHVAGDLCGTVVSSTGLLDYSIEALSDVMFVPIQTRSLSEIVKGSLLMKDAFRRHINVDAAISRRWILNLGQRPAYHRLAHLICEIEARLRAVGLAENGAFRWCGTQSDLGAAAGLSLVHTNKTLAALERDGLAVWRGGVMRIDDLVRLREVAEFRPAYLMLEQQSLGSLLLLQGVSCHDASTSVPPSQARLHKTSGAERAQDSERLRFRQTVA